MNVSKLENLSGHRTELTPCPCCCSNENDLWATEQGFNVVRCLKCGLLYVNPRPDLGIIDAAVRTGEHSLRSGLLNVKSRRIEKKVSEYKSVFADVFADIWQSRKPIFWVDVGSGYGETLHALATLVSPDSSCVGVEPMTHKAEYAKKLGLSIYNSYLDQDQFKASVISAVDIFSHIPNFKSFLKIVVSNLAQDGEIFVETGNLADLNKRSEFPGELGLPDHLVFAGESQIVRYLNDAGFDVVDIRRVRIDGIEYFLKNLIKRMLGYPVKLCMPYTSNYRQLRFRAKLKRVT